MLLNSTDLKAMLPVSAGFSFDNIKPDIKRAQRKYIRPILGATLEAELEAAYLATPTAAQQDLIDVVQPALAHLAAWLYLPKGNVFVTDNGVMAHHTENLKPAFEWQMKAYRSSLLTHGNDGLDTLIEHLEEVAADDFVDWLTSLACTLAREHFINTAELYTRYVAKLKGSRYLWQQLRPTQRRVEDGLIKGILGAELYAEIKGQILSNTVSEANTALLDNIRGTLAHKAWAEGLLEQTIQVDEEGVHVASNILARTVDSRDKAEYARLEAVTATHKAISMEYEAKIKDTLYSAPDTYPLWRDSGIYVDPRVTVVFENKEDSSIFGML